ncbi:MAG: hypothetical protein ACFE96_12365, partial [Candidatus Hermodarchaeota archaeon]
NFDDFSRYFHNWQKNVINFGLKRNLSSKELENYIMSFPNIDSAIVKSLFAAKEFYAKKRRYYKKKINSLKQKDIEYTKLLEYAYKERKHVSEPKIKDEIITSINHIKNALKEIEFKILNLNNKIEEQILDLDEENYIIEEIQNLDRDKQVNLRHLKKLEGNLSYEIQSNRFYKTVRTIKILEINVRAIEKNLKKWSKRRVNTHKKMLEIYRKAKHFENIKKQIEKELIGAKQATDKNLQLFYKLRDKSQKQAFQEQVELFKSRKKEEELRILKTKYIIKKKKTQKKYTKEKLKAALDKQKSGKKLDFYELKLILEHTKQKK